MYSVPKWKQKFDGVREKELTHLPEVSTYNSNYYTYAGYILYGKGDDDNFTGWWVSVEGKFRPLGGSYCSDDDRIIVDPAYCQ